MRTEEVQEKEETHFMQLTFKFLKKFSQIFLIISFKFCEFLHKPFSKFFKKIFVRLVYHLRGILFFF